MNPIVIDMAVSETCINPNSYGEICVQCGCCNKNQDHRDRIIKQIRLYKELLQETYLFDNWSKDRQMLLIQKRNKERNVLYFKRKIRVLKKILRNMRKVKTDEINYKS